MSGVSLKAADMIHKGVVTGLVGYACYAPVMLTGQAMAGRDSDEKKQHPQASYLQMLKDKAAEEYAKYYKINHRDWYEKG